MLTDIGVAPLLSRLEDASAAVREAALRSLVLLVPVLPETSKRLVLARLSQVTASSMGNLGHLPSAALKGQFDDSQAATAQTTGTLLSHQYEPPSSTADLIDRACLVAEKYLLNNSIELSYDDIDALRYVDAERATLLVTILFKGCLEYAFLQGYEGITKGNSIVQLVWDLGPVFTPDVPALFEVYLEMHDYALTAREEWYRTRDDDMILYKSGHLVLMWQIAWTVSRAGLVQFIAELSSSVLEPDERHRLAALHLVEDAIRYTEMEERPPRFGGGTGPPDVQLAKPAAATKPVTYETKRVFYGTDRARTGYEHPSNYYGANHAALEVGVCTVSIPTAKHKVGKLESPEWWKLELREDPASHFILLKVEHQSERQFVKNLSAKSKDKEALIFVHGYRVTFEDAARRTAQLAMDLEIDVPIFYSWPSGGKLFQYLGDIDRAETAKQSLLQFLDLVATRSGAKTVHLIAHSMGNLALTRALVDFLARRGQVAQPLFREIILAAPDMNADVFKDEIVPQIRGKGSRLTLYASSRDYALVVANFLRSGLPRAGYVDKDQPLVVDGVETIDVSAVNTSFLGGRLMGHSYFGARPAVLGDMWEVLKSGKRPGDRFGMTMRLFRSMPTGYSSLGRRSRSSPAFYPLLTLAG